MKEPPTFEEAVEHITDPSYGIGLFPYFQLPSYWPGTDTAKIHDLRYDYLKPGEDTTAIDDEAKEGWYRDGCSEVQTALFYKLMRLRGQMFKEGEHVCAMVGHHEWVPCSYGQVGMMYDLRCSTCGVHRSLDDEKETL